MKYFIYGVPGSGKSYIGKILSDKLGYPYFEVDALKRELQLASIKEEDPFVFLGTCQAYKYFGNRNKENIKKGLTAVRGALLNSINNEIKKHKSLVLEGAFLDPTSLLNEEDSRIVLVVVRDEDQHKKQFFSDREENEENKDEFLVARIVQDLLLEEASTLKGVIILENSAISLDDFISNLN